MVSEDALGKMQYTHKEEMVSRIKVDEKDRASIREKSEILIDPFDMTQLVNIVTGKVADSKVNVNDAVDIGKR